MTRKPSSFDPPSKTADEAWARFDALNAKAACDALATKNGTPLHMHSTAEEIDRAVNRYLVQS